MIVHRIVTYRDLQLHGGWECARRLIVVAPTLLDGPFVEVLDSSTSIVDVCIIDNTQGTICHEVRDTNTTSYHIE